MLKSEDLIKKIYLYLPCEGCSEEGIYFVDNFEEDSFLKCNNCGKETSDVWCKKCGMGGPFVKNIEERPDKWKCPDCNSEYMLPSDFYTDETTLYLESDVPKEILKNIDKAKKKNKKGLSNIFKFFKR